jgi:hypothetical protein
MNRDEPAPSTYEYYSEHSLQVVNYCVAELFYIFTTSNLVQSNDQKKFYRERVVHSSLRLLNMFFDLC